MLWRYCSTFLTAVVGGRLVRGEALREVVHPPVRRVADGAFHKLGVVVRVAVAAQRHENDRPPKRGQLAGGVTLQPDALRRTLPGVGEMDLRVADQVARVALDDALHLSLGGVGRVGADEVRVAPLKPAARRQQRGAVRARSRARDAVHIQCGAGTHNHVAGERADREADALVPVQVVLVVVPAPLGDRARVGHLRPEAVVVGATGAHPAQPVEGVERLGLPVVRALRLHVEQRCPGTRPVERAVLVRPVEPDRLSVAEPAPGVVVPPGAVAVESGRQRQREHPDARHHRRPDARLAAGHARQPQPGRDQQQQHQPAQGGRARVLLGHGGAVEEQQGHEARDAERRGAAPGGPEGQRRSDRQQRRGAEQDRPADPLVRAVVGPVHALHAREPAIEAVGELAPVGGQQQAAGQAGGHQAQARGSPGPRSPRARAAPGAGAGRTRAGRLRRRRRWPRAVRAACAHPGRPPRASPSAPSRTRRAQRRRSAAMPSESRLTAATERAAPVPGRALPMPRADAPAGAVAGRGLSGPCQPRLLGSVLVLTRPPPRSGCPWHGALAPSGSPCTRPPRTTAGRLAWGRG